MSVPKLLDCPFCGSAQRSDAGPSLVERGRNDRMILTKAGRPHRRIHISHVVSCSNCGAEGPSTLFDQGNRDAPELTPEMVVHSEQAAAFEWNRRTPISDRAYELVNRLITEALQAAKGDDT